ncbi:putative xanthine dehydrogenase subunit D [Baekduia alba]|uniref:xanthine dehydrogenase subunit D n=1 Tax=Baekduia alba TaxID=2997333 RepID=UPI00233F874A|nr:xanthine dehydrogenase subunit D [Baekduia alba]WCB94590.1 putative xanthine dehydrogenase subunit D [Baekduia alba]
MSPQQGDTWQAQHPRTVRHTGTGAEPEALLDEDAERAARAGHVGARLTRSDGPAKVAGEFLYSSDLRVEGMLFGATVRSPHASALIRGIDVRAALDVPGVHVVLTHADVPGDKLVGNTLPDQPVLAIDRVRHHGEPVAIVAAEDAVTARRAAALVVVEYAPVEPLTTVEAALAPDAPALHPAGNVLRAVPILAGAPIADAPAPGEVVVTGRYEVGIQDQAFLGPESGLAIPDGEGGVELHIATQWLHVDRDQVAAGLGLPAERVRLVLGGVGGAFGAREDLSIQLHACMLALVTGRPVKMAYLRDESFTGGHVHRHPAWMEYEHRADAATGLLTAVRARLWLDGGAYASSSTAVVANATTLAAGPYACPDVDLLGTVVYTNNPPCGAMRGFGAVQVAVAYEAQMDKLAAASGLDPIELRRRNALRDGGVLPTGQVVRGPIATVALLEALAEHPLPAERPAGAAVDPRDLPGSQFAATRGEGVRRGVGYAAAFKNIAFSEGFDDASTARARLTARDGRAVVEVHTAAVEVGQGVLGVQEQIARTELGVEAVVVAAADTAIDSAGSASASRLTWMVGGAVRAACVAVRTAALERAADWLGRRDTALALRDGAVWQGAERVLDLVELVEGGAEPLEATRTYRHAPTEALDPVTGQGDAHAGFGFVAHRAVVEVDVELGLARVVQLTCAQDVGRVINPMALEGQLEGGSIQGLGLALSEEVLLAGGLVQTQSLGSYRIPTIVDAAPVDSIILELGDPETPYGLRGVGEMPSLSSTPAILAALRAATGHELPRAPVRPEELVVHVDEEEHAR